MADRSDIDEIRQRVDLVSVVEQHVTLKRAGRRFRGLCPFHSEKSPSFHVDPDAGYFKCFGCGEHGDVFTFVEKIENLTFAEALERLALMAGVTLSRNDASAGVASSQRDRIFRVNEAAQNYFSNLLLHNPEGRRYAEGRGLLPETIAQFRIGYASEAWDGLAAALRQRKIPLEDAELAGLIAYNDSGNLYDRLRGRLVFPIQDVHGRVVGFGGRIVGESGPGRPKYWNSPETPAFAKSKTLYGLNAGRKAIAAQGSAMIVEGYMDVVTLHQHGFENAVATLGTSLTEDHARVIAPLARKVVLAFDADAAGLKAAMRAGEIFRTHEIDTAVIEFPAGEDPDSLLRAGRKGELAKRIDAAVPVLEFQIRVLVRTATGGEGDSRVELFKQLIPILAKAGNDVELDRYLRIVARFHPAHARGSAAAEERIRADVVAYSREANVGAQRRSQGAVGRNSPGTDAVLLAKGRPADATERAERQLIRALAGDDQTLAVIAAQGVAAEDFGNEDHVGLVHMLLERHAVRHGGNGEPDETVDHPELRALLSDITMSESEPLTRVVVEGAVRHLRSRAVSRELARLKARINEGAATPSDLQRHQELVRLTRGSQQPSEAN